MPGIRLDRARRDRSRMLTVKTTPVVRGGRRGEDRTNISVVARLARQQAIFLLQEFFVGQGALINAVSTVMGGLTAPWMGCPEIRSWTGEESASGDGWNVTDR